MFYRLGAPDTIDLLLNACRYNRSVIRYVHSDKQLWERALQRHIVTLPVPNKYYYLKTQWAATLYTIVQPYLDYEDVLAIVSYNATLMTDDDVLLHENEKRAFACNSVLQYEGIVSKHHKRTRTEAGFL